MNKHDDSNKAGDTETTEKEFVKRETGEQDVPKRPAENTGLTSPTKEDLEHPEQDAEDAAAEEGTDDEVARKIEKTNEETGNS